MCRKVLVLIMIIAVAVTMMPVDGVSAYALSKKPGKVTISSVRASGNTVTVKWKKIYKAKKYQIAYKKASGKKWTKKTRSASKARICKIKKLKYSTKYKVKVRAYRGKWGKWSKVKTITTKKKPKPFVVYEDVIVSGDNAYCGYPGGIKKVNLKTQSVKTLAKGSAEDSADLSAMKLKKGYIYYIDYLVEDFADLYRVKTIGGGKKCLAACVGSYMIRGSKIYYEDQHDLYNNDRVYKKVMKLNGKTKKKTTVKAKMKWKKSNKSGYKIVTDNVYENQETYDAYADYYLKTPDGSKVFLGRAAYWEF